MGAAGAERRAGVLALDEFSAVSRRVPLDGLTERCRSLGLAVQVAAQSWAALAPGEDERARLAATASGGVVVMRCPDPDALCRLSGTRVVIENGRKIIGQGRYRQEGTGRVQRAWVVDPDRVRNFRAGQAASISGAACTYVQVAPYRRSPLPLPTPADAGVLPVVVPGPREPPAGPAPGDGPEPAALTGPELPLPGGRSTS